MSITFSLGDCLKLALFVGIFGFAGCALHQTTMQDETQSGTEKKQVTKRIESSVNKPKRATTHQNEFQEAIDSLLALAKTQQETEEFSAAAANVERALRINPRSTQAYHRLAEVRLEQGRFKEAEQLAKKALTYVNSGNYLEDNELKASLWYLISIARSRDGNKSGAERALIEAHKLEMRSL